MNILARDPEIQARIQTNVPARVPFKIQSKRIFYGCVTFFESLNFHLIYFLNTTPNPEHLNFKLKKISIRHEIQLNRKCTN